ncbi:MAG: peptidoglycan DL-endopeptidase CwlO [Actinomycetota bacterium]|nr:peptidoglycan DL-endopeptidase CwlO [Actinomycetota bacterium]
MRISTRIAVPAAVAFAGATLFATVPAMAENILAEPPTTVDAQFSTQAAINSALRQEGAMVQRKHDADAQATAAMQAAVVANWVQQAEQSQAAAEQAAAEQAAAEQAAAEQAAAEQQWLYEQAVAAEMIRQAEAAAYSAPATTESYAAPAATESYAAPVATGGFAGGGAVGAAMSMVGAPYVAGGQSPSGFDCSGFVKWAYEQAGVSLPGGSYNQIGYGTAVSADALAPGDLVFYGPGGSQHVAIYIGGGQVVQASNYDTGVHVASLTYIGEPTAFRRI